MKKDRKKEWKRREDKEGRERGTERRREEKTNS